MPAIPFTLWAAYGLTGGGAGSPDLDYFDGDLLADGDIAWVFVSNVVYQYILDADGGAGESSPDVIVPDTNPGTKNWVLQAIYSQTLEATVNGQDNILSRVNLKDTGSITNALGDLAGGTDDIDLTAGNVVTATVSTSAETFTFSNPTASDEECGFVLYLTNGGSQTVNWPASVDWAGGTEPTLTAAGVDILVFTTVDGGTIWNGFAAALDVQSP